MPTKYKHGAACNCEQGVPAADCRDAVFTQAYAQVDPRSGDR